MLQPAEEATMAATNSAVAAGEVGVHEITMTAATVDTVTFSRDCEEIEVMNVDGAAAIYFTVDKTAPTVGGKHCRIVPAAAGTARQVTVPTSGNTIVKLISSGTPKYSVTGSGSGA